MIETRYIRVSELEQNNGQIEGLPKNPRLIRDSRFEALKKSITDSPEMLELREIIVFPNNGKYVIICGNMRYKACVELGYHEMYCKILPDDTSVEKLREYAIKDNVPFGQDDFALLSLWDKVELESFGYEFVNKKASEMTDKEFEDAFNSITDNNALYPIIPKVGVKNELFIIVSESEIDSNNLREKLSMNKMRSYKSDSISKSNVISITDVLKVIQ